MPHQMDTGHRLDELTDAAVYLVTSEGIGALTIRKVAAVARLSPSSVTSHLENKQRMIDLVTKRIADRLDHQLGSRVRRNGALGLIPDDEALPLVRTWLAMCELARGDDALAESVSYLEQGQRDLVQWACRLAPRDELTLDAVQALVVGVWTAMCARTEPMPSARAVVVLRHVCTALGVELVTEGE
jgi:AcrR family transcriptional regulator